MPNLPPLGFAALLLATLGAVATPAAAGCGESRDSGHARQLQDVLQPRHAGRALSGDPIALVLLAGGSGFIDLGADGCPRRAGRQLPWCVPVRCGTARALPPRWSMHPPAITARTASAASACPCSTAADLGRGDRRRPPPHQHAPVWLVRHQPGRHLGRQRGGTSRQGTEARTAWCRPLRSR